MYLLLLVKEAFGWKPRWRSSSEESRKKLLHHSVTWTITDNRDDHFQKHLGGILETIFKQLFPSYGNSTNAKPIQMPKIVPCLYVCGDYISASLSGFSLLRCESYPLSDEQAFYDLSPLSWMWKQTAISRLLETLNYHEMRKVYVCVVCTVALKYIDLCLRWLKRGWKPKKATQPTKLFFS